MAENLAMDPVMDSAKHVALDVPLSGALMRERWRHQAGQLFVAAAELAHDGVGISRESYGGGETATLHLLRSWAERQGLACREDMAANGLFSLPGGGDGAMVVCGSHIDSVPQGGNYDGLAGVVAGLLVLDRLRREGRALPFTVVATRGEESAWYGKAYIGSSAALGTLTPADLDLRNKRSGRRLRDAMSDVGADVAAIGHGDAAQWPANTKAYLELHIEQGPVMVARGWPVAVVPSIRGNVRHNRIACVGAAGHSGAVPRCLRNDALFAVADLLMRLDGQWSRLLEQGADLVVTSGTVATDPQEHAVSRIPGRVEFSFEARSADEATLERFHAILLAECDAVAAQRGVRFDFDRKIVSRPAAMDGALVRILREAAHIAGQLGELLPSGAGHDAAQFANAGIPSGMIFVRNQNGSHNPQEAMDLDDFVIGVEVLYQAVLRLA